MGGSKVMNLTQTISNVMKTTNQHEQRIRRHMTSREEAVNRCLNSLIHTLHCREGASCRAHGCQKMKRVVEHTKTCPRRTVNYRGCAICTQLLNLCFYHSKMCRANVCPVPFCRIMKKKMQALNEHYAQKQSLQAMKPVLQFPIPPLHPPSLSSSTSSSSSSASSAIVEGGRKRSVDANESSPKRIRLDENVDSTIANNNEAQNSNVINSVLNRLNIFDQMNAQLPQTVELEVV